MALTIENGEDGATVRGKINKLFYAVNQQTDSYTLVLTDAFKTVEINKASAVNLTVPLNSSVAFEIGTIIYLKRTGAGQMTVVATGGVTVTGSAVVLTDPGLNVVMALIKTATDTWDLQNGASGNYTTWTPGFTGFSANPGSVDATYYQNGKFAHIRMSATSGTSNATSFTITGLPVAPRTAVNIIGLVQNAGATLVGRMDIAAGGTTITLYANATGAGGSWTASGNKNAYLNIFFETQ